MDSERAVVALLLVLAGAVGGPASQGALAPSTDRALQTSTPTATATAGVSGADPATPDRDDATAWNPWRAETVHVAVTRNHSAPTRSVDPLVERALAYWEEQAPDRADYEVDFELVADTADADVSVQFAERIDQCGARRSEHTAGCADFVPRGERAPSPTRVRIETGYNDTATVSLLKHEFGHTLGFTHDDADDLPFMNATTSLGTLPQPDIDDRAYHWRDTTLSVHVGYGDAGSDADADRLAGAVESVFATYEASEALPEAFAFETATDPADADIVIRFDAARPPDARSDATYRFVDPDYDGAPERYTRYEIVLGDVSPQRAGDVVGWYLALALYADGPSDVPDRYS